ncbi:MAG TPA: ABC transporter family substrate-binding protein [Galbitalea sp.]|nr:ABC transporter family substrate-binding protein [Galbitalea sp.]
MKLKRIGIVAAVVAAGALALSGCSAGSGDQSEIVKGTSITVAQNSGFTSYNGNSATGNSTYNQNILYLTTQWFNYYDATPKLVNDTKFGTETLVKKSPLTVKYTINPGVKWSDGAPVTAADLLLSWVSSISKYNDPKGVNFTSADAGSGLDLVTKTPTISADGQSMTMVYSKPFVDWVNALPSGLPAHVVYDHAFPSVKKAATADKDLIKAVKTNDTAALTKIAKVWSTAFDMTSTPSDKSLILSDGPYIVSNITKNASISLVPNKAYTWGPLPHIAKFTFRVIQDPTAQVQALQNGEVSVIEGQADADTTAALKALSGVTTTTTPTSTYEHVDLTFNNGGPFDPATYGGDASKALLVRQAFLDALPRQEIVTKLINPIAPNEQLDNSLTLLPGAAGYSASVATNGSSQYASVNIAAAKAALAQAGVTAPVSVKFLYGKSNTRRAQEFALIQASEAQAGFKVIDEGNDNWPSLLGNKSYDAILFAWQYTSLAVTSGQSQWQTGGGNNFNGYSNSTVDSDYNKLQTDYNTTDQVKLLGDVDKQAWADAYGVPLFQFPDVTAYSNNIQHVVDAPLAPNVFWNFFDWTIKKQK